MEVMEKTSPYLVEGARSGVRHAVTIATGTDTALVGNVRKAPTFATLTAVALCDWRNA